LTVARSAVLIGVALVAALAVYLFALRDSGHEYTLIFENAGQLVKGDNVQIGGRAVGSVRSIELTPNNQAAIRIGVQEPYAPLREGTQAIIRLTSLSGIANRYVAISPGPDASKTLPDRSTISTESTTTPVDLDQLFNTLDAPTRKGLQEVIKGSASQYAGQGKVAQAAFAYLNPALASSSVLFREINRDTGKFTNFIVKSGNLVSDIAQRRTDLSGLVQHLAATTGALAAQHNALGLSIQRLPGFMRLANTTFVNLRNALNDVKPLVDASKPVAPKLRVLLEQLKPLAEQSVPTVRDLSNLVRRPGRYNDLTELTALGQPLAGATVRPINANGKRRLGAFPQSTIALNDSTPELATARPYAVDLTGWFEGYTHPGTIDANGGSSRVAPVIGVGSIQNGTLNILPAFLQAALRQVLAFGSPGGNGGLLTSGQGDRCPGSMERGAVWYPQTGFPCNPSQVPTGP
jgi:phospholipid/cholesterol/gamma-HCH transport system substrate-binding protein